MRRSHSPMFSILLFAALAVTLQSGCIMPAMMCNSEELGWDEEAPDGSVPEDFLVFAEGYYELTGQNVLDNEEVLLGVGLQRRGESVTYTEPGCGGGYTLPVTFTLVIANGVLDETFEAEAYGSRDREFDTIVLTNRFQPEDIVGSWQPVVSAGVELVYLEVIVTFTDGKVSGSVQQIDNPSSGPVRTTQIFTWGD